MEEILFSLFLKQPNMDYLNINENPSLEKENVINVTDFGEIIKVSEELFKPILYWFDEKTEEAQFCVISENVVYKYILKK